MQQLLLLPETREERLEREVEKLREQCEKVRKGQYAKIGQLVRMYEETRNDLDTLKAAICRSPQNYSHVPETQNMFHKI